MSEHVGQEKHKWKDAPAEFADHVATMPRWHKFVLAIGVALLIAGGVGWVMTRNAPAAVTTTTTVVEPKTGTQRSVSGIPKNSSGFVGSNSTGTSTDPTPSQRTVTTTTPAPAPDGWVAKLSPETTRVGGSVVAGFVVGWLFRAFLKTMAFLALLAGAGLFALSYFGVINVDMTAVREGSASAVQWLTSQADRFKDVIVSHLPSTGGGALGAFLGFRRR